MQFKISTISTHMNKKKHNGPQQLQKTIVDKTKIYIAQTEK